MMDGRQGIRHLLGAMAALLCLCWSTASSAQSSVSGTAISIGPGSLNGMWTTFGYKGSARFGPRERVVNTIDGKLPPMQPWAAQLLEERIRMTTEKGEPFRTTLMQCLPGGVPEMVFGSPYPTQIIESAGQVTILYEMFNHFRVIYLGETHPADPDPTFMGHSVGHWQGDTLIVDTVGLTERTTLDEVGIPHSAALHVIERYRRVDKDTLEIIDTIDDPKTFTQPWNVKVINKAAAADLKFIEYICENDSTEQ